MPNSSSIILYDDGDWSEGHYKSIFCLYLKACLQSGMNVCAACPLPNEVHNWISAHCPRYSANCTVYKTCGKTLKSPHYRLKPFIRLAWWARASRTVRRIRHIDAEAGGVLFLNINHLRGKVWADRFADRLMPCPWAAMIFDSSCVRQPGSINLPQYFNFLNAKQCKAFGVTDEKMIDPMQKAFPQISILFLPDATPEEVDATAPLARDIISRSKGRKIVGLLGMLHKRKGLLTALKLAQSRPDLFFLFAGAYNLNKFSPSEKNFVQSFFDRPPENCFCYLQRIADEAEFNALVQLTDIIFAVYPGFTNSSGLLTKAGLFEKPCLVAEGNTCMADRVEKYNLGIRVPPDDITACSESIDRLLRPDVQSKKPLFKEFRTDFNEQALQTALQQLSKRIIAK